ncbi:MAG TPA: DUF6157 family protein, partial [Ilumatobacteraceae bacterium]|nr:DUF6157 family protein [Ilumatobacteraceae bacterium]
TTDSSVHLFVFDRNPSTEKVSLSPGRMHRTRGRARLGRVGTTNYSDTFIQVADDCPVAAGEQPPDSGKGPAVAALQFAVISANPYALTSDDVLFEVHARRNGIPSAARTAARAAFFATSQACLRASPLAKRYGWGLHHDAESRVALVPLGSDEYQRLVNDPSVKQVKAMRSKRV